MKQTRCESWVCVCWRDLCEYSKRMLSLSPTSSQKIISILFSEGIWRLSAQATIFGENLTLPQWIPSRKVRNKHPQPKPQYAENLIKICIFYQWNWLHYWIYPSYNIVRQFISNIPLPGLLRKDKWAATDLSSLYLLLTMQSHLEMPGQPMRVYLPDGMNALRGSTLVHLNKW